MTAAPQTGRRRRLLRRAVAVAWVLAVILLAVVLPLGCVNRVVPPANVADPVEIYLVDHGRTPSIVLPTPTGGMARYVYGDWNWYALGRTNACTGAAALLWPTRAGLGRELLEGPPSAEGILSQVGVVIERIHPLVVERSRAEALHGRLEGIFARNAETLVHNPGYQLSFVHHPDRYTYFWNSNHQIAHWLAELGCEVRGPAFNSIWRVVPPPGGGAAPE